jgi:hypothetical protein
MDTNEKVSSQPEQVEMECRTPSAKMRKASASNIQMEIGHE